MHEAYRQGTAKESWFARRRPRNAGLKPPREQATKTKPRGKKGRRDPQAGKRDHRETPRMKRGGGRVGGGSEGGTCELQPKGKIQVGKKGVGKVKNSWDSGEDQGGKNKPVVTVKLTGGRAEGENNIYHTGGRNLSEKPLKIAKINPNRSPTQKSAQERRETW